MYSEAVEDYLKAIYEIQQGQGRVSTSALAERLRVAPPSATNMVKKLANLQLVEYKPYRGVILTQAGDRIAVELIRRHRLMETFLVQVLDLEWDQVHAEADRLEHVLSPHIEERIDALLGSPTADPHGAPIPTREGTVSSRDQMRLTELESGRPAAVTEVNDRNPDLLRYLGNIGIVPNEDIAVLDETTLKGPIHVHVAGATHLVDREVAEYVMVTATAVATDA
jgi:DtxR family Mn-dependent transcriptional regulator